MSMHARMRLIGISGVIVVQGAPREGAQNQRFAAAQGGGRHRAV
jgi:hypothetical protein